MGTSLGGQQEYGMWKEVTFSSIEMSACSGGCKKGEVKLKLGNSDALVSQSTSMIMKCFL